MDDFVIAHNPEEDSSLPYVVRIPLGGDGLVLKTKDVWPRTAKLYCHRTDWPAEPNVVERVPVRVCRRRGAAIDLVLDRGRESRSQFVFTRARGREMIFWQTARVAKQARPNVTVPSARASGQVLHVLVDSHERYAWRFNEQQATTATRALPVGDYGVERDGRLLAVVERKSLDDLVSSLTSGKLRYQAAELASVPRAAIVVEARYSALFALDFVRPAVVLDGLAEHQVRFPTVPITFTDNRKLAQEWAYRFLGAAIAHLEEDASAEHVAGTIATAGPLPPREPTAAEIRGWAVEEGIEVSDRGRIPAAVRAAYDRAHSTDGSW